MSQAGRAISNSGPAGFIQTLTGNVGGPVSPTAGNIDVIGTGVISVVGNPGTSTLTITPSGAIASSFITNPATGTATPALGVLTFAGTGGIAVSAAGSIVTIDGSAAVGVLSLTTDDTHVVTPAAGTIIMTGTHGLNTTGTIGPNTATIAIDNAIVLGDLVALGVGVPALTLTTGDLTITSGNINLPTTAAAGTDGVLYVNAVRFMHSFGATNAFLGAQAGNFTLTGFSSTGIGAQSLQVVTNGSFNTALGFAAGGALTSGSSNVAIGSGALGALTTTGSNVAVGASSLTAIVTGTNNTSIGYFAGSALTTNDSNNISIGTIGVAGDNGTIRIGTNAINTSAFITGIDGVNVGSTAKVVTLGTAGTADKLGTATITAGTGINVTPGANTITITATTGGVTSISGNSGGAQTGAVSVVTANSTPLFVGAAGTITLDFNKSNLILGNNGSTITIGAANDGFGAGVLQNITSGSSNSAFGNASLQNVTIGSQTSAFGASAGTALNTGGNNTLIGFQSGLLLQSGNSNVALGYQSGSAWGSTVSNNIAVGSIGSVADSARIRIGTNGTHTTAFVAGIDGVNVGSVAKVVTMASDQLGTATITAGAGISITPGANTITISGSGGGLAWSVISADQTAVVNNGYFCNKAGTLALALPAASAVGDVIEVANENTALGIQFTQAAGQQILIGNTNTTLGATGTLTTSAVGDTLKIVCKTANTIWRVTSIVGNWSPA